MDIKGIVFDKDGTLMEFEPFWCNIALYAVRGILEKIGVDVSCAEELLRLTGFDGEVASVDGIMRCGTHSDFVDLLCDYLKERGLASVCRENLTELVEKSYSEVFSFGKFVPSCENLRGFLENIRLKGIRTALITNDSPEGTRYFLDFFGIEDLFDDIYSYDGSFPQKPEPDMLFDFAKKHSLECSDILAVGDTISDVSFAQKAGAQVVVIAKNDHNKKILSQYAQVIDKIEKIEKYL